MLARSKFVFGVIVLVVMMIGVSPVSADESGCPAVTGIGGKLESDIVGASYVVNGTDTTYYFDSLVDRSPTDGVPGLIAFCVYPGSTAPDSVVTVAVGYNGGAWSDPPGFDYFAFNRPDGNPSNIPLDGTEDIEIGTATWLGGAPAEQIILLHINDAVECQALYGGDPGPGTCFVYPDDGEDPNGESLTVLKFYDANLNGINDDGQNLANWEVWVSGIGDGFTPWYINNIDPGNYTVGEYYPIQPNWVPTTPTSFNITIEPEEDELVEFGNVCLGGGGGRTLGFWSNKNGRASMNDGGTMVPEFAMLTALNLRRANGTDFDPASYNSFRSWLLSATATNMAYMLSAQLAAMALNVEAGYVDGAAIVWTGTEFISINGLMAAANTALGVDGLTLADDPNRAYQEYLKDALDDANNNRNFVQPTPCPYTFAARD